MKAVILIFLTLFLFKNGTCQIINLNIAKSLSADFLIYKTGKTVFNTDSLEISEVEINDTIFFYNAYLKGVGSVLIANNYLAGPFLIYNSNNKRIPFDEDEESGFYYWIEGYKDLIRYVNSHLYDSANIQKDILSRIQMRATSEDGFFLIQSEWNQSRNKESDCGIGKGSYNKFVKDNEQGTNCDCNKCTAGCVSIAVSQIMRYWRHPVGFDWCSMPFALFNNSPEEEINAIAKLIADVGKSVETDYCNNACSSESTDYKAMQALKNKYDYDSSIDLIRKVFHTQSNWKKKIIEQLDNDQPVYYSGKSSKGGFHAFICDGYSISDPDFFHFNFGHGSDNDDTFYFMFNDDGTELSKYKKWQQAIINIKPASTYDCSSMIIINEQYKYLPLGLNNILYYKPVFGTISIATPPNNVNINSGENVIYRAFNEIILENGFVADFGSEFIAEIIDCPYNCILALPANTLRYEYSEKENSTLEQDLYYKEKPYKVYPNPSNGFFLIEKNIESENFCKVEIVNSLGTCILKTRIIGNHTSVDISNYPNGLYIITISDSDGIFYEKIVLECY
jgi:hypothetical protein